MKWKKQESATGELEAEPKQFRGGKWTKQTEQLSIPANVHHHHLLINKQRSKRAGQIQGRGTHERKQKNWTWNTGEQKRNSAESKTVRERGEIEARQNETHKLWTPNAASESRWTTIRTQKHNTNPKVGKSPIQHKPTNFLQKSNRNWTRKH